METGFSCDAFVRRVPGTMSKRIHSYQPRVGHFLPHDPIASILGPRPIGRISSQDADDRLNLAPYSFFNIFNYRPPIVAFSSVGEIARIKPATPRPGAPPPQRPGPR